jgi:hypothetical protein
MYFYSVKKNHLKIQQVRVIHNLILMKKYYLLVFALVCFIGVHAQSNLSGEWKILNGVSVFVETGSELENIEPGIPATNQILTSPPPGATFINFDDVNATCGFAEAVPLTTEYSAQGVTFSGSGFELLDQCSSFGVSGYSQPNHVAWNNCCSGMSETLTFNPTVSNVSFLAGSGISGTTLSAEAFNSDGLSLGIVNIPLTNIMQTISLPYSGIARVQINPIYAGIIDNLMFESDGPSVPISYWAILLSMLLVGVFIFIRFKRIA